MRTSQSKISSDGIRFSISLKNKKSRESYSHGNPQKFLWYYFCDVVIAICIVVLFYSMFIISCFQHLTSLFRDSSPGLPLRTVTYIILSAWSIAEWLAALSATSFHCHVAVLVVALVLVVDLVVVFVASRVLQSRLKVFNFRCFFTCTPVQQVLPILYFHFSRFPWM